MKDGGERGRKRRTTEEEREIETEIEREERLQWEEMKRVLHSLVESPIGEYELALPVRHPSFELPNVSVVRSSFSAHF